MIRLVLTGALLALASPAFAQTITAPAGPAVDPSTLVKPSDVDAKVNAAIAAERASLATKAELSVVQSTIPKLADAVPPAEMVGGTAGSSNLVRRADAATPRITRAGMATTTTSAGDWAITWSMPLSQVPVVLPIPVNASQQPIVCNVTTRTMTGATGRCWLSRSLPAALLSLTALLSYDVFGSAAPGIQVQVLAIPPTQ